MKHLHDKQYDLFHHRENKLDGSFIFKILTFITSRCCKHHFLKTFHCILDDYEG